MDMNLIIELMFFIILFVGFYRKICVRKKKLIR